ncbi:MULTISPECIES: hypothetical protein [Streptomyces]|uniref:hypothetical protein n=1 Tax=Streptomyces TaxID=1883 RepID=UPI00167A61D9|nr:MULTISPECIES: hypothetical protein [Streptomyces]MBK3521982.1 hypothetical protein [Streptomyces sp. MBT70]GGS09322.1 hypothetical protein GCM10010236_74710 [Streptomyces eurythermus]
MRHNGRAPLKASQMRPEHLNLRENEPTLVVCPDCDTWHRLKRSMILPHRSGAPVEKTERRYFGDKPAGGRRCPGSAQRVVIDITVEEWGRRLLEADSTATGRRSARQHSKPLPAPAAPVHRLASIPGPSARLLAARSRARTAVNEHRSECAVCRTGRTRCPVGRELEIRMGHTDASVRLAYEQHEMALRAAATPAIPRAQQWRRLDRATHRVDGRREQQLVGDAPQESRPVPLGD